MIPTIKLKSWQIVTSNHRDAITTEAILAVKFDGRLSKATGCGKEMLDAFECAFSKIAERKCPIVTQYQLTQHSTKMIGHKYQVTAQYTNGIRKWTTSATHPNPISASWLVTKKSFYHAFKTDKNAHLVQQPIQFDK
jgi:hypothetical protein